MTVINENVELRTGSIWLEKRVAQDVCNDSLPLDLRGRLVESGGAPGPGQRHAAKQSLISHVTTSMIA